MANPKNVGKFRTLPSKEVQYVSSPSQTPDWDTCDEPPAGQDDPLISDEKVLSTSKTPSRGAPYPKGESSKLLGLLQTTQKASVGQSLGAQKAYSLLAGMGIPLTDAATELRQIALAERSRGRRHASVDDYKHCYFSSGAYVQYIDSPAIGSGGHVVVTNISNGSSLNNRLTNRIKIRRITIHHNISYSAGGGSTGISTSVFRTTPTVVLDVVRDKVPITPGTERALYATDANPPTDTNAVYTGLGTNFNTTKQIFHPVRNVNTMDEVHVYRHIPESMHMQYVQGATAATAVAMSESSSYRKHVIDCHDVEVQYSTTLNSFANVNQIQVSFLTDTSTAQQTVNGLQLAYNYMIDVEFRDVQD